MNWKILITALVIVLIASFAQAQPWMNLIDKDNPNFYDIQDAFEQYWEGRSYEKGKGWKQFKRWEWFMQSRVDENGTLDPTALWRGWEQKMAMFPDYYQREDEHWFNLGPETEIPSNGGGAGRINCITFDPDDGDIIWIGSPSGGLWRSADGGDTWSTTTDHLPVIGVSSILIDPTDTDIMYIATGDGDASDTYSIGVLKSTDGGDSWDETGLNWEVTQTTRISKMVMHPDDPNTILAAASNGIYKTTDGADNWTQSTSGNFKDIEIDPVDPTIWYAARSGEGVFRSIDTGDSWQQLTNGLPDNGFGRIAIAVTPATILPNDPPVLYALYVNNSSGYYGTFRSLDGGDTWTTQSTTPNLLGWSSNGSDSGGQGWYDLTLGAAPDDPNTVYVGGVNKWKSTDGGVTWELIAHWWGDNAPYVHADHHAFEFSRDDPETIFSGNDGGIFKSTNGGDSWTDLSDGLGIHQFYRMGASETNETLIIGGSQDNGTSLVNGTNWTRVIGGDGMESLIDYSDEAIMYGELYYGNMRRSMNGGSSFSGINDGVDENGAWVSPFVIHPTNPEILFRATPKVYKTTNRGNFWTAISLSFGGSLTALTVALSNPDVLYAAHGTALYRTTDGGTNWETMSAAPSAITYIAVHPNDANTLWTTHGQYVANKKIFKSTDGGETWTNLSDGLPNLPANTVVVDPNWPEHVYVGMDVGIYFSGTGGGDWTPFDMGLPNVVVSELEINREFGKIRAATFGRGIWESYLNKGSISGIVDLDGTADDSGVLISIADHPEFNTISATDGSFELANIPAGSYVLEAYKIGYLFGETEEIAVELGAAVTGIELLLEESGPAPLDLSAESEINGLVPLTWTAPSGDGTDFYRLYRGQTAGGPYTLLADNLTETSYDDSEIYNGVSYYYVVTAVYNNPAGESFYSNEVMATPGITAQLPFFSDFEEDNGGNLFVQTVEPGNNGTGWEWGIPATDHGPGGAVSGQNVWATGLADDYPNNADVYLLTPLLDLTSLLTSIELTFAHWYEFEGSPTRGFDGGNVAISLDGGQNWDVVQPSEPYSDQSIPGLDAEPGFAGSSDDWETVTFDLSPYAGNIVMLRFRFGSDSGVNLAGWYIDDVSIEATMSVEDPDETVDATPFFLAQNRPNPFNPITTISFSLPSDSPATLIVYDMSGRVIRTLVDRKLEAGSHQVEFDAADLPSGVYLYRLEAGPQTDTRRMVLLK